jgi:hypothetical protein
MLHGLTALKPKQHQGSAFFPTASTNSIFFAVGRVGKTAPWPMSAQPIKKGRAKPDPRNFA